MYFGATVTCIMPAGGEGLITACFAYNLVIFDLWQVRGEKKASFDNIRNRYFSRTNSMTMQTLFVDMVHRTRCIWYM